MVEIIFTGDISFANINNFRIGGELEKVLQKADIVIGNFEAVMTNRTDKWNLRPYHLKADPKFIKVLSDFDAFSLANNHLLDYKKEGLIDTLDLLKSNGKTFFGAGLTRQEAEKPYLAEVSGIKIACFGATHYLCAGIFRKAGTANMNSSRLFRQITEYKKNNYFVIIMPHWGYEHFPYPSPRDRILAKRFIDAGADVVVGSHPHELQGIETISQKQVFYSLGNFIFSMKDFSKVNWLLTHSFIVKLIVKENLEYTYDLLPYVTSEHKNELLDNVSKETVLKCIDEVTQQFNLSRREYNRIFYKTKSGGIKINSKYAEKQNNPEFIKKPRCKYLQIIRRLCILFSDWQEFKIKTYKTYYRMLRKN